MLGAASAVDGSIKSTLLLGRRSALGATPFCPFGSFFMLPSPSYFFFFFFQAEDGIRDHCVTGVQTCALPIYTSHTAISRLMTLFITVPPSLPIGMRGLR